MKVLRPTTAGPGYPRVVLFPGEVTVYLHQLALRTFVGEPSPGQEARHLDGDRTHNLLANLRWGTKAENAADTSAHGTRALPMLKGGAHPMARLTRGAVSEIRQSYAAGEKRKDLACEFGISVGHLWAIGTGRSWR